LKIIMVLFPAIAGHIYTKVWIEGALPHVQRDMIARFLTLKFDFERPRWKRLPFIPSIRPELAMASEPEIGDNDSHPLRRMREQRQAHRKR
jgi:hypothetical protein